MTQNEKEPRRTKLNWLDRILLAILAAGAILLLRYSARERKPQCNREREVLCLMRVKVEEPLRSEETDAFLRHGATVRNGNGTVTLGTVREIIRAENDLEVTVRMRAELREDGMRVGGIRIGAGMTGRFRFDGFWSEAEVLSLAWEENV